MVEIQQIVPKQLQDILLKFGGHFEKVPSNRHEMLFISV